MKSIKWAVAVGLVLVAGIVVAQQYNTDAKGYAITASSTSNLTAATQHAITLTKYEDVAIHVKTSLAGSGTDSTVMNYYKSVDGVTYETTPSVILTIVNTGTTTVNTTTNVTMGAAGYLKLGSIVNADGGDVLTVTNTFAVKPQRFGK
jgi:hypothetical protein